MKLTPNTEDHTTIAPALRERLIEEFGEVTCVRVDGSGLRKLIASGAGFLGLTFEMRVDGRSVADIYVEESFGEEEPYQFNAEARVRRLNTHGRRANFQLRKTLRYVSYQTTQGMHSERNDNHPEIPLY